jgi:hypothetical protein
MRKRELRPKDRVRNIATDIIAVTSGREELSPCRPGHVKVRRRVEKGLRMGKYFYYMVWPLRNILRA